MIDRILIAVLSFLFGVAVAHADVALMLNDAEKAKIIQFIARGLADHPEDAVAGVYLLNKINTAPIVSEHKESPAEPPKEEPKP